jgi:Protein of Unknown function (DUF2784)
VHYGLLADLTVLVHAAFILFAVCGGLLVLRWPRTAWLHVPAVLWAAFIEFSGRICPLTPLENHYRELAGESGYSGGFIEHYVLPVIYPAGLTRDIQLWLGLGVVAVNVVAYAYALRLALRARRGI